MTKLWGALKEKVIDHVGTISIFTLGFFAGGLLISKNFTIKKDDFEFSTEDDKHALGMLKRTYGTRTANLLKGSCKDFDAFDGASVSRKRNLVERAISQYLVPTSHDRIFGSDVVIYNGKGKPTILMKEDYSAIKNQWIKLLEKAEIDIQCVDRCKIGQDYSAYHEPAVLEAINKCVQCKKKDREIIY